VMKRTHSVDAWTPTTPRLIATAVRRSTSGTRTIGFIDRCPFPDCITFVAHQSDADLTQVLVLGFWDICPEYPKPLLQTPARPQVGGGIGPRRKFVAYRRMRWIRKIIRIHLIQFVKQRAITHLEPFGSLLPVPVIGAQHLENDLALEIERGLLGDALERER